MPPLRGDALIQMRLRGRAPEHPIIVSFIGYLDAPENFVLYAQPDRRYDWTCVKGLDVIAVAGVQPPVDLKSLIRASRAGECSLWIANEVTGPDDHPGRGAWLYVTPKLSQDGSVIGDEVAYVPWPEEASLQFAWALNRFPRDRAQS